MRISLYSHHLPVRLKGSSIAQNQRMQYAEWLGNTTSLVIVHENDIYFRQSPSDDNDVRLTHTGVPGLIYNGVTDFLYQGEFPIFSQFSHLLTHSLFVTEEILKSQKALWSSNDGSMLLYASFNDTNVGQMIYPWFSSNALIQSGKNLSLNYIHLVPVISSQFSQEHTQNLSTESEINSSSYILYSTPIGGLTDKGMFPESRTIRYPTPGTLNPEVELWLLNLTDPSNVQSFRIEAPETLLGTK